jgi:hypothetical protein
MIRHEILKLEIARLLEMYHKTAWSLVRHVYFKLLGNHQLVDPIFNDLIKVAMESATFWENMQTLKQSASTIEENYKAFVSWNAMEHHCNRRSRNQREPNNNNRSRGYKHHYTFMATTVDSNTDPLGNDNESLHPSREPVQTPGTNQKWFSTETEEELYEENKKLHTVL